MAQVEEELSEVSKEEIAHVGKLLKRVKFFGGKLNERAKGWKDARIYADGSQEEDSDQVRVNIIGSKIDTIQSSIYAKEPEIAAAKDERLDPGDYKEVISGFAETIEAALNVYLVKDAKLKKRGKSAVRSTLVATRGWIKLIYQKDKKKDPHIINQINDTQDNVDAINKLLKQTEENNGDTDEYESKLVELKQQIQALESQIEVVVAEGLVMDNVPTEDIIILDSSPRDIDEFDQSSAIAHRIRMTVSAFTSKFGKEPPKGVTLYHSNEEGEESDKGEAVTDDMMVTVYEVWSKEDLTVYTVCEGMKSYVRAPFQPKTLGEQWYPFFGLQLRRVDGVKEPKSHAELMIELADEYCTRRTNAKEHRQKNIPVRLLNKSSSITDDEISNINGRSISTDVIGVTANPDEPLQNQLGSLPEIPYNPQMYDTQDVLFDIETVSGAQDAASGAIRVAKTATEAEIQSAGLQGRVGEALDVVEDWLTDISIYAAQLLLQEIPANIIKQRFGDKAVWPTLNKQQLFELVNITIRAGSTSKPNKARERDQWIQILPMIQEVMEKIIVFKQQGQDEMATATIELLDETLRRFDEKLDAKQILGISDEEEGMANYGAQPQLPPEVTQIMEEMKTKLAELSKENEVLKQGHDVKMRELDVKEKEIESKNREIDADEQIQAVKQADGSVLMQDSNKRAIARKMADGSYVIERV